MTWELALQHYFCMIKHFTTMALHCPAALLSAIVLLKTVHASTVCLTGYHAPSLYHQYCCLPANNGNTIKLRENNRVKIVVCPTAGLPRWPVQMCCCMVAIFSEKSTCYVKSDITDFLNALIFFDYVYLQSVSVSLANFTSIAFQK